jgi:hypothetical protein
MKFTVRNVLIVIGLVILVVLLIDFNRRTIELDQLDAQLNSVSTQAMGVTQTQVALVTQLAYATSDAAVQEWAYRNGKWVKSGETLVELVPSGELTPTPPAAASLSATKEPNWRIWLDLFFTGN